MRIAPDDDLYRVRLVWLGPQGMSFPWTARYQTYGVWILSFVAILAFEGVMPFLSVTLPPTWEFAIATLGTAILMKLTDYDRPLRSIPQVMWREGRRALVRRPERGVDAIRTARITVVPTGGAVKAAPPVKAPKAPRPPKAKAPKPVKAARPPRVKSVPAPRKHDRRAERTPSPPSVVAVVIVAGVLAAVAHALQGVVTGG